jgi:hypothetical protein
LRTEESRGMATAVSADAINPIVHSELNNQSMETQVKDAGSGASRPLKFMEELL